jgi:hypothetical protein
MPVEGKFRNCISALLQSSVKVQVKKFAELRLRTFKSGLLHFRNDGLQGAGSQITRERCYRVIRYANKRRSMCDNLAYLF